jgi:dCMP deaminase
MISIQQYMRIAQVISESSYCKKHRVGAILVKDDNIIALGYNGTPRGFVNKCEDELGNTLPEVLHAETNTLTKVGREAEDSTMYTTMAPCLECAKMIIQCKILAVYYLSDYRNNDGLDLLTRARIYHQQVIYEASK